MTEQIRLKASRVDINALLNDDTVLTDPVKLAEVMRGGNKPRPKFFQISAWDESIYDNRGLIVQRPSLAQVIDVFVKPVVKNPLEKGNDAPTTSRAAHQQHAAAKTHSQPLHTKSLVLAPKSASQPKDLVSYAREHNLEHILSFGTPKSKISPEVPETPVNPDNFKPMIASTPFTTKAKPSIPNSVGSVAMEIEADGRKSSKLPPRRMSTIRAIADVDLTPAFEREELSASDLVTEPKSAPKNVEVEPPQNAAAPVPQDKEVPSTLPESTGTAKISKSRLRQTQINFPSLKKRRITKSKAPSRPVTPDVAANPLSRLQSKSKPLKVIAEMTDDSQENSTPVVQVRAIPSENFINEELASHPLSQDSRTPLVLVQPLSFLSENHIGNLLHPTLSKVLKHPSVKQSVQVTPAAIEKPLMASLEALAHHQTASEHHKELSGAEYIDNELQSQVRRSEAPKTTKPKQSSKKDARVPITKRIEKSQHERLKRRSDDQEVQPGKSRKHSETHEEEQDSANKMPSDLNISGISMIRKSPTPPRASKVTRPKVAKLKRAPKRKSPVDQTEPQSKKSWKGIVDAEEDSSQDEVEEISGERVIENGDSGVPEDAAADSDDHDILYDPYKNGCKRPGLRVRRVNRPYWIQNASVNEYAISRTEMSIKDVRQISAAMTLMKEHNITKRQLNLPNIVTLPSAEVLRRIKAIIKIRSLNSRNTCQAIKANNLVPSLNL